MLKLSDKIAFGKYLGRTLAYVLLRNPSYIVWASDNVKGFRVSAQTLKKAYDLKELVDEEYRINRISYGTSPIWSEEEQRYETDIWGSDIDWQS